MSFLRNIIIAALFFFAYTPLMVYVIRDCVHKHAFNGMSKTSRRRVIKRQSRLSRIFMTYVTKCNTTEHYSPIRTWVCLICYYIYCASAILSFCIALAQILEYALLVDNPLNPAWNFARVTTMRVILYVPFLCLLSFLRSKKVEGKRDVDLFEAP